MTIYENFDFANLKDPDFREDSVREELIVPLLRRLGYSASGPNKIIRGKRLTHPFVYIGTLKKGVTIVPDYILQREGSNCWVLDAKAPGENIREGKNVEQAYSYAIHKDVRVPMYGLCNGHEFVLFHISQWPHLLRFKLSEIEKYLGELVSLVGTASAIPVLPKGFRPDLGMGLLKSGLSRVEGKPVKSIFATVHVTMVGKVSDGHYTLTSMDPEADWIASFDFPESLCEELFNALPSQYAKALRSALRKEPSNLAFRKDEPIFVGVCAELTGEVLSNHNESYCPFKVSKFF